MKKYIILLFLLLINSCVQKSPFYNKIDRKVLNSSKPEVGASGILNLTYLPGGTFINATITKANMMALPDEYKENTKLMDMDMTPIIDSSMEQIICGPAPDDLTLCTTMSKTDLESAGYGCPCSAVSSSATDKGDCDTEGTGVGSNADFGTCKSWAQWADGTPEENLQILLLMGIRDADLRGAKIDETMSMLSAVRNWCIDIEWLGVHWCPFQSIIKPKRSIFSGIMGILCRHNDGTAYGSTYDDCPIYEEDKDDPCNNPDGCIHNASPRVVSQHLERFVDPTVTGLSAPAGRSSFRNMKQIIIDEIMKKHQYINSDGTVSIYLKDSLSNMNTLSRLGEPRADRTAEIPCPTGRLCGGFVVGSPYSEVMKSNYRMDLPVKVNATAKPGYDFSTSQEGYADSLTADSMELYLLPKEDPRYWENRPAYCKHNDPATAYASDPNYIQNDGTNDNGPCEDLSAKFCYVGTDNVECRTVTKAGMQMTGLNTVPLLDLTFRMEEHPQFLGSGEGGYNAVNDPAYNVQDYHLEKIIWEVAYNTYGPRDTRYAENQKSGASMDDVQVLDASAEISGFEVGASVYMRGRESWVTMELTGFPASLFNFLSDKIVQPFYVYDLFSDVAQHRMHDRNGVENVIPEGDANVQFELKNLRIFPTHTIDDDRCTLEHTTGHIDYNGDGDFDDCVQIYDPSQSCTCGTDGCFDESQSVAYDHKDFPGDTHAVAIMKKTILDYMNNYGKDALLAIADGINSNDSGEVDVYLDVRKDYENRGSNCSSYLLGYKDYGNTYAGFYSNFDGDGLSDLLQSQYLKLYHEGSCSDITTDVRVKQKFYIQDGDGDIYELFLAEKPSANKIRLYWKRVK